MMRTDSGNRLDGPGQVVHKPVSRQCGDGFECARLLEEVGGTGDDGKTVVAPQVGLGLAVEADDDVVVTPHDKEGRRRDSVQAGGGEIGTTGSAAAHKAAAAPVLAPK
jgi:hypothetical protein